MPFRQDLRTSSAYPLASRGGPLSSCAAMKTTSRYAAVLVTAPDLKAARKLAKAALAARLAACVNLVSKIESHYWWQGQLESSTEVLLILKTTTAKLSALERIVLANHPYDTPEFVVLPLRGGTERYLAWLSESVAR